MSRNMTTIESSEKERSATMRRRGQIRHVRFPYNLGWKANIQAVLGDSPFWWCWPQNMKGDGLEYPVSAELGEWLEATKGSCEPQPPGSSLPSAQASLQRFQQRVDAAASLV